MKGLGVSLIMLFCKLSVSLKLFPNKKDRLKHIFEKQVYGLAPTEIIYKIATAYILGFDGNIDIKKK